MSDIKNKLSDIKNIISNPDEATKVVAIVMEIVEGLEDKMLEIEKRQAMLEEKTGEIFEMLSDMEEELIATLNDEFEAECPYCGEDIADAIPEELTDFECPHCHNVIELEMMFGDCGCDCGECDGDCHGDCDCDCDDDEDEDSEDENSEDSEDSSGMRLITFSTSPSAMVPIITLPSPMFHSETMMSASVISASAAMV